MQTHCLKHRVLQIQIFFFPFLPSYPRRPPATMKYFTLALLLCALATSAHAFCYQKEEKADATHCVDDADGTIHEVGSSWNNSKCMECTCSGCCARYSTPTHFPDDCVSVFDPVACEYIVHKKDDNTTLCELYGAVGK